MYAATAQIDITRPTGSRLVREKKHSEYSLTQGGACTGYSIDEIREMGYKKLSAHYGIDVSKL